MKKILFIFLLAAIALTACCPNSCKAQAAQPERIVVNASDLTPDQYAKIKAEQALAETQKKMETYGKWVGVGGEIGTAIRDGLNAVVDVTDRFGKTEVGKFTMYLIAWKVIGKDLVRIGLGLFIGIFLTFFMIYSYRKLFAAHKVRTKGAWYQFWVTKEYKVVDPDADWEGYYFVKSVWWVFLLGGYGIVYAIMFA